MIRYFSSNKKHSKYFESFEEDLIIGLVWYDGIIEIYTEISVSEKERKLNGYEPNHKKRFVHVIKTTPTRGGIAKVLYNKKNKFRYLQEWVEFKNDILKQYYYSQEKFWEDVLPERVALWASRKLQQLKQTHGDSCTDNYRVARVGNTCQERRYRRQRKNGCCGFFDCIEICPINGLSYRLGFNFGH